MSEDEGNGSKLPEKKEGEDKKDDREDFPIEPEVLDKLPPEVKEAFKSFSLRAFSGSVPVFNPILKKINERHIDKVLDQAEKDSQRDYDEASSVRKYGLIYTIIC